MLLYITKKTSAVVDSQCLHQFCYFINVFPTKSTCCRNIEIVLHPKFLAVFDVFAECCFSIYLHTQIYIYICVCVQIVHMTFVISCDSKLHIPFK